MPRRLLMNLILYITNLDSGIFMCLVNLTGTHLSLPNVPWHRSWQSKISVLWATLNIMPCWNRLFLWGCSESSLIHGSWEDIFSCSFKHFFPEKLCFLVSALLCCFHLKFSNLWIISWEYRKYVNRFIDYLSILDCQE